MVSPSGWVSDFRINIFKRNGEMDDIQVEVFNSPVCKLLAADRLDSVAVVERVPELGDEEKIFALDEAIFNCTSYPLASFFLVAVVWLR
jgi:hypothetical protein